LWAFCCASRNNDYLKITEKIVKQSLHGMRIVDEMEVVKTAKLSGQLGFSENHH
jgi:hypothetical protein